MAVDIDIPRVPKPDNPVMVDRIIGKLQDALAEGVGWLDYVFGRAQRLVTLQDKSEWYYPGVYVGGDEYLDVLPGQCMGNRVFFNTDDPELLVKQGRFLHMERTVGLVCWYDLSTIYAGTTARNTEAVKWKLLDTLDRIVLPTGMRMSMAKVYDRAENIFREYSLREVDSQYLMQPYGGVRIDMDLVYREACMDDD